MCELECIKVPLPEIEQADDPHNVEGLHGHDSGRESDELPLPRRRKSQYRCNEDNGCLDPVATRLDGNRKPVVRTLQYVALRQHLRIEPSDQTGADRGERIGPRNYKPGLRPRRQFQAEQDSLQNEKAEKEANHGSAKAGAHLSSPSSERAEGSAQNSA